MEPFWDVADIPNVNILIRFNFLIVIGVLFVFVPMKQADILSTGYLKDQ